ncbi:MAG: formate--tetrahydrofolate ligase [Candidatus Pelagibacter sp. TMED263]|nr:MAG: formate--tetrahydrofolate ligase [Candidatus Pelagibacter sp. TMED263]|tara:strand:- start:257 stop:1942 length:1686 start_codon:yes stop_codon:yes gene_type:complete
MNKIKSDIEIARAANIKPIKEVLKKINISDDPDNYSPMGRHIAKLNLEYVESLKEKKSNLILVTAITPTSAGEGKTTTSVGLTDGLNKIGKKSIVCLREPSLGPSFGMKGGAAGGGYAQVIPMEQINLHFTGDFHAITSAHNLLSALIDNHIYWGNKLNIDQSNIVWKRVVDLNDRALRTIEINLEKLKSNTPRKDSFDITVASEVMAIFCLSNSIQELEEKIGNITVAYSKDKKPIYAKDLKAQGPMTVLLKEAVRPNVVQTLENNLAIIHGGPFANIAHGCNSILATKTALRLSEYVVTEAGFGADLGAEKFLNIKCRKAGIQPSCVVLVATIRALKMHGGVEKENLKIENTEALIKGLPNLERHIENIKKFGLDVVVAINHFVSDTESEIRIIQEYCSKRGVKVNICTHWANGSSGTIDLANNVIELCDKNNKNKFKYLYSDKIPILEKIEKIAKEIYKAKRIEVDEIAKEQIKKIEQAGFIKFPVCIAKTQYSFSTDPKLKGAPSNHTLYVREVRLSSGAEFLVVVCGSIMTMPGLPRVPAADNIKLNKKGEIEGLF